MEGLTAEQRLRVGAVIEHLSVIMTCQTARAGMVGHRMYDDPKVKTMFHEAILRARDDGVDLKLMDVANVMCKTLLAHQCQAVVVARTARDDVMEE